MRDVRTIAHAFLLSRYQHFSDLQFHFDPFLCLAELVWKLLLESFLGPKASDFSLAFSDAAVEIWAPIEEANPEGATTDADMTLMGSLSQTKTRLPQAILRPLRNYQGGGF